LYFDSVGRRGFASLAHLASSWRELVLPQGCDEPDRLSGAQKPEGGFHLDMVSFLEGILPDRSIVNCG